MDQLWLHKGLDLLMTPYNCASTWDTGGVIEVPIPPHTHTHFTHSLTHSPTHTHTHTHTHIHRWYLTT